MIMPYGIATIIILALAIAIVGEVRGAQSHAQAQSAPPSPSSPSSAPTLPSPSTPPSIPLTPHDPASLTTLHHALAEEQSSVTEYQTYIQQANAHLAQLQTQSAAYEKIAQDEIMEIKRANGWGEDVTYDRVGEKFVRRVGEAAVPHTSPATKEKK